MWHRSMRQMVPGFIFSSVMVCAGWAQVQGTKSPTAEEIVTRMLVRNSARQAALEHYVSVRRYKVEYTGTGGYHAGELVVNVEYSAPDKKKFTVVSESGSKLICERVLRRLVESEQEAAQGSNRRQAMLSVENYNVGLVGEENIDGVRAWVLKVSPKVNSKFTYRGRVWVSMDDYATVRIQGEPAKNPSWWINRASFDSRYVRRGEFWLPGRNVSTSHVRIGGEATLTIDYGDYQTLAGRAVEGGTSKSGRDKAENAAGTATSGTEQWTGPADHAPR